ncbi:hypothetical protein C4D60_Mb04t08760 [Musa balbisiana]|uniref:Uncharacterized protein n=1 Tax=Musa balbisiana TaxID=52838 RepID=A0A4S8KAL9_MUSBA|nr:hypothetical protein C4D60_Mb04t08760 [Musa balbisiana]
MDDQDSRKRSIDGRRFELWCLPDTRRNECRGRVQIRRLDRGRRRCSGDCRGAPAARRSQDQTMNPKLEAATQMRETNEAGGAMVVGGYRPAGHNHAGQDNETKIWD